MNRYDVVAIHLLLESDRGSYSDEFWEVPGRCLPCREGCTVCNDDTPCLAQEDTALRLAMVSFQGFCMLMDFISMLVVYHFRRNKVCAANITFSHFCKTIYNCPNTQLLLNHSKIFSKHGIIYYSVGLKLFLHNLTTIWFLFLLSCFRESEHLVLFLLKRFFRDLYFSTFL